MGESPLCDVRSVVCLLVFFFVFISFVSCFPSFSVFPFFFRCVFFFSFFSVGGGENEIAGGECGNFGVGGGVKGQVITLMRLWKME